MTDPPDSLRPMAKRAHQNAAPDRPPVQAVAADQLPDAPAPGGSFEDRLLDDRLLGASFVGLLTTQFLTVINDNVFRWLVIGIGKQYATTETSLILALGSACFVLPYLLLAAPAGYLSDRFSKRSVIVGCKGAEVILVTIGAVVIASGQLWGLFAVVALLGAQAALFAPAKLGSIPETLREERVASANGAIALTTVIGTVIGTVVGNWLVEQTGDKGRERWWLSAVVLVGVALVGWWSSLFVRGRPAANPSRRFPWDAPQQTVRDLTALASNRAMFRVALGIMFFWSLGLLAQLNIDQFAAESGATTETHKSTLLVCLVLGVAVGSVLAVVWSAGRVELGVLPIGALGLAVSSLLLFTVPPSVFAPGGEVTGSLIWACSLLFALGMSAGLFDIPLSSYLQHRSPADRRGSYLAASNFITFSGMLAMSIAYAGLRTEKLTGSPLFSSRQLFLLAGLFTIPVFVYIVWLIPQATIRFIVWLASRTLYRVRVVGREHLPDEGGALLVSNHISWLDGVMVMLAISRPVRVVAFAGNFENRWLRWLSDLYQVILLTPRPKAIVRALATARQAVANGELVFIFPEGGISRSGLLQTFKPGMMKILEGTGAPVIPVYLDELWGSIFSFERGKFFWKWPKQWPYPISIHFGPAVSEPEDVHSIRQAVLDLGATAVQQRAERQPSLTTDFIRRAKQRGSASKVADSTGVSLSGRDLLIRTLVMRRLLLRHVLRENEPHVGVLLPPCVPAVVVNAALALDRRVSVNLNYTVSTEVMNACLEQAGIRHVLTSRRFLEKLKQKFHVDYEADLHAELVLLEDFPSKATAWDKVSSALAATVVPAGILHRSLGLADTRPDDVLTIIFTSGSTGVPKGVMLTHANVASNVRAIDQVVNLRSDDVLLGILPFFHSFGYTITLWTVLALDVKGAYHNDPTEGRQVGKLCKEHGGTILLSTPTFLRAYTRRCEKDQFATLDVVVAGAERLPKELCDAFEEKFGMRPVEGYGTTELSPLVAVNIPPTRALADPAADLREGTVGKPIPGVSARVVDLDTGEVLPVARGGMLQVKGPNVMKGYLGREDLTRDVIRDGWYTTGDVAIIDADGFITITGRESRFSKIGGEMVPHIKIEETLNELNGSGDGGAQFAVSAAPDERKGERIVVIHTRLDRSPHDICQALAAQGLPNLFIPSPDSFVEVPELPVLGTGKLDLRAIKKIAMDAFGKGE